MAPTSAEKVLENFPHPTIQLIIGKPTYETLAVVHLKLNTNEASVCLNWGNDQLGYLSLTVNPFVYNVLSSAEFVPPANPGQHPLIPNNSTTSQISNIRWQHQEAFDEFQTWNSTDKALKSQLIAELD